MGFRYIFFFILLFNAKAAVIQFECPDYCTCDVFNDYRRATCQDKKLVTVEIGVPPVVELLDISHNQIRNLENEVFTNMHLANLKLLNLSYNQISQISLHAFEGLDNLKSMDLSYNSIQYFLGQWFFDLRSLRELYLRGNNLQDINEQPRIELPFLKVLDLSDNKIAHLHPIIFTSLPNLEILDIGGNFLIDLRVEIIRPLPNLRLLVADGNSLECSDISLRFLKRYIKENDITYVGPCKRKQRLRPKQIGESGHFERMEMKKPKEKIRNKNVDNENNNGRQNGNKHNQDKGEDKKSFTEALDEDDENGGDNEEYDARKPDNNEKAVVTKLPNKHNKEKTRDEDADDNTDNDSSQTDNNEKAVVTKLSNKHNKEKIRDEDADDNTDNDGRQNDNNHDQDKTENRKLFTEALDDDDENDEDNDVNDNIKNKNKEAEAVTKSWNKENMVESIPQLSHKNNKQKNNEENDDDEFVVPQRPRRPSKNHKKTTQKNGWMVDDIEENKKANNSKPTIKYVEVCNNKTAAQTKRVVASNTGKPGDLKKRLKVLGDLFEKVRQKYFPNAKNPFKKNDGGNNENGGGNNENLPKDDVKETVSKEKKDPQYSKPPPSPPKRDSVELNIQSDCSDCEDALNKFKPRPKNRRSPEQELLLDEEEPSLGSTPAMSKRTPPQRMQRSPRDSGSELNETLKPAGFPPRRGRSRRKSDESDTENFDFKPKSRPGRPRGRSRGKSDESDNENVRLRQRSRSGSPNDKQREPFFRDEQDKQRPRFGEHQQFEGSGRESEGEK
ncbi:unnamed protein product [Diabrotica balteata]|uniref:Uncharacterized protein n=1 Tax=Diabrotica balteata TaxID=107213 RepID=A0A9N9SY15_DIABA|nr:unnamed protein product [Diabrotica balteata]